ncbi:hypothetical protein [Spiroplasma endosymbiont of Cantharis lateralis]|uniref:hypothetical protein n=1 Tax=Spiroplasma endosymbiont of Cantharis lateralis TaxID=3066277 RepID=UPI00313D2747
MIKNIEKIEIQEINGHIKVININTLSMKILKFKKTNLDEVLEIFNSDFQRSGGVYLFKWEDEKGNLWYYIGETDNFFKRFNNHEKIAKAKDIIMILSTDILNAFDYSKRKYFEYLFIDKLDKQISNRIYLENNKRNTDLSKIESIDTYTIKYYFQTMLRLILILDSKFFQSDQDAEIYENDKFNDSNEKIKVFIKYKNEVIECFFNKVNHSIILNKNTLISDPNQNKYISNEVSKNLKTIKKGNKFYLENELIFKNPSAAANLITGVSSNGWIKFYLENYEKIDIFRS